jgi:hypothetical protein
VSSTEKYKLTARLMGFIFHLLEYNFRQFIKANEIIMGEIRGATSAIGVFNVGWGWQIHESFKTLELEYQLAGATNLFRKMVLFLSSMPLSHKTTETLTDSSASKTFSHSYAPAQLSERGFINVSRSQNIFPTKEICMCACVERLSVSELDAGEYNNTHRHLIQKRSLLF